MEETFLHYECPTAHYVKKKLKTKNHAPIKKSEFGGLAGTVQ